MIVAASTNNVIGVDGELPWHLSEDLKKFKAITMGKPMIMGRATYESIGRALPGRRSIVLSRQKGFSAEGCDLVASPSEALEIAGDVDEVMIIGGGKVYADFLPMTDRIYLTRVDATIEGDTWLPALATDEWKLLESENYPANEEREYGFSFEVWTRTGAGRKP
jgi:dihydrofolate reductase